MIIPVPTGEGIFFVHRYLPRRARASLSGTPEMRIIPSNGRSSSTIRNMARRPTAQMTSTTAAVALRRQQAAAAQQDHQPEDQDHQKREWNGTGLAGKSSRRVSPN